MKVSNYAYTSAKGARKIDDSAWEVGHFTRPQGLRSRIFRGDGVLDMILRSGSAEFTDYLASENFYRGQHVERLELALKIVLPDIASLTDSEKEAIRDREISATFSHVTGEWILLFQEAFNIAYATEITEKEVPFKELGETGKLDAATLFFLDRELVEIKHYDALQAKVIHNAAKATWVGEYTVVSVGTCSFWTEPLDSAKHDTKTMKFNERVMIRQVLEDTDWCYVELLDGTLGYLKTNLLWTASAMPDTGARLYEIPTGSPGYLLNIVRREYNITAADEELDIDYRFYANLLIYINNPGGGTKKKRTPLNLETGKYDTEEATAVDAAIVPDISAKSWKDYIELLFVNPIAPWLVATAVNTWAKLENYIATEAGTGWDDWKKAKTIAGKYIWLPSKNFAHTLREVVNTGSITGNIKEMYDKLDKTTFDKFKSTLDKWWPAGTGFRLEFGLGATFVAPIGIDGDYYCYMYRDYEGTEGKAVQDKSYRFKLYRRGIVKGGLDAGAGAGLFVGMGGLGKHGKWVSKKEQWGVGVGGGAEINAGVSTLVQEEYIFDLDRSTELAFMMLMAGQQDFFDRMSKGLGPVGGFGTPNATPSMVGLILKAFEFLNLDPYDYLTRFKVEAGIYAMGTAAGSAGLRFGDPVKRSWKENLKYWGPGEDSKMPYDRGNWCIPRVVAGRLGLALGSSIEGDVCVGFEMEIPNGYTEEDKYGFRIPNQVDVAFYIDAEILKAGTLPSAAGMLGWLPSIGIGAKIKATIKPTTVGMRGTGAMISITDPRFELYAKSGEMDFYDQRPASEAVLSFDPTISFSGGAPVMPKTVKEFFDRFSDSYVHKRISLSQFIFDPGFARFHRYRARLTTLVKHNKSTWGIIGGAWLTFKFQWDGSGWLGLAKGIVDDLVNNHGVELKKAVRYLMDCLKGQIPPHVPPDLVKKLLDAVIPDEVELHAEMGLGLAIAGRVGKGELKARVRAYGNVYGIYHRDVLQEIKDLVTDTLESGLFSTVIMAIESDVEQAFNLNEMPTE